MMAWKGQEANKNQLCIKPKFANVPGGLCPDTECTVVPIQTLATNFKYDFR